MLEMKRVRAIKGTTSSIYSRHASNPPPKKPPPKKAKIAKGGVLPSKVNEITSDSNTTAEEKIRQLRAFNIKTQHLYKNTIRILINLLKNSEEYRNNEQSLEQTSRRHIRIKDLRYPDAGNKSRVQRKKPSDKVEYIKYQDDSSVLEKVIIYKHIGIHRSQDIKRNMFIVSTFMVSALKTKHNILVNDIFELLKTKLGVTQKDFMLAINFLFAIGAIEYQANTDELRYLK
jgi:hypothetical protein